MRNNLEPKTPLGRTSPGTATESPWTPPLALVTGSLDPVWQILEPGQPFTHEYRVFRWALMYQESWEPGVHLTYWQTHLPLWPHKRHKLTTTGLKAQHAAAWLHEGYSQSQIARALYGKAGNATSSLFPRAKDYRDWLATQPLRLGGLAAIQGLEDSFAAGVDESLRASAPIYTLTDDPDLLAGDDPDTPDAERARRYVRRRWRYPRVIDAAEVDAHPFGSPEPISSALLYSPAELEDIKRADAELHEQAPYHGRQQPSASRRLTITPRRPAASPAHRAA